VVGFQPESDFPRVEFYLSAAESVTIDMFPCIWSGVFSTDFFDFMFFGMGQAQDIYSQDVFVRSHANTIGDIEFYVFFQVFRHWLAISIFARGLSDCCRLRKNLFKNMSFDDFRKSTRTRRKASRAYFTC
jgi:hypothetical protein